MKDIFAENGYLDAEFILENSLSFNHIIAARGVGKSYLTKRFLDLTENPTETPILYVRRSNVKLENSFSKTGCDFLKKDWFPDAKVDYSEKQAIGKLYLSEDDYVNDRPAIIGVSMSTFQNKTGIDLTNVYTVIFDEYIPQKGERPIKHEFQAYKNIMELVFRNRDEAEQSKIKVWFFGNSNAIMSNILIGYRLISKCYEMCKKRTGKRYVLEKIPEQNTMMLMIFSSPISEKKAKNPFYKSLPESRKRMELYNEFSDLDETHIAHRNLREYVHDIRTPLFSIWVHKSELKFYVTKRMDSQCSYTYSNTNTDLEVWQSTAKKAFKPWFLEGRIDFSDYECQCDFLASFDCASWNDIV